MLLMLAGAAAFVYLRLHADLDDRIDASLRSRLAALTAAQGEPSLAGVPLEDPEETFVQLLSPTGQVLGSVGTVRGPALELTEVRRASVGPLTLEKNLQGVDGRVRLLAADVGDGTVVVVGQSLLDRNDALSNVISSFAVGGAVAILVASVVGYLLATVGLAPVEAIRRRARDVSFRPGDEGLPLPVAHDEIRRLGETLNEMLTRLRASFERESRFVADASHELRTPIAIIKTELEAALHVAGAPTSVHTSLRAAAEECDRLGQLAEDLLVIARSGEGQLPIRPERTLAPALLAAVRDRFSDRAGRRDRIIRITGHADLVVFADPFRIRQALGNLVENALRHGAGDIALAAGASAAGIALDVRDDGSGFPADFAAHAFERFSRGDRSRGSAGVGLGLAIVQAIAEAHGGHAAVVGTAPTIVRIWLPDAG